MLAIQYARWSSMEQTKGSTLARQLAATADHISEMGWTIHREPLIDRGKSAYTGDNIETGQLGRFANSILSGEVDPTSMVLVVEELDRLSRQPADVMLSWLSPLVRRGLSIKVVQTGQMISRAMLDVDMAGLMMILITAFGSHSESRKKAQRVAAAWEAKRAAAREGKDVQRNHRRPKWVEVGDDGSFQVPEIKAHIIRMIFDDRIAGMGKGLIAKKLNGLALTSPAYAPWELDAGTRKAPQMWTPTYVGRIICNRAVMGEWQPFRRPRKGAVEPAGEPVLDYYPRVIDAATFTRANEKRIAAKLRHNGRGKNLSNLLGTRAVCGKCGGRMDALGSARPFVNKKGEKKRHYFLYCRNAKIAKSCDNSRGWPYDKVESPLLDRILTLAMDDQHFNGETSTAPLEAAVHNARANVREIEHKIEALIDAIEAGGGAASKKRLLQRETELAAAETDLYAAEKQLEEAKGKVSPAEHIRRVAEVRAMMWDDDEDVRFVARSKVKTAIGDIIERMSFSPHTGNVTVILNDRMALFTISPEGTIRDDLDFLKMFGDEAGPGYGRVEVRENGVIRFENDLDESQKAASKAYVQRYNRANG